MMKALIFLPFLGFNFFASAQDEIKNRLENSPRHQEWVTININERKLSAFVVYPEKKSKAAAVIVIHENRGLNDWARATADRLAEEGYIAIAPDLLSEMAPNKGKTSDFETTDLAREALGKLTPEQVKADLDAAFKYVTELAASNGKASVAGFCWGGGQSLRYATSNTKLANAFVFYGSFKPDASQASNLTCPVYGFYAGNDARINENIPSLDSTLKASNKKFDKVIYEGAGHAYMRAGMADDSSEANRKAMLESWDRLKKILAAQ